MRGSAVGKTALPCGPEGGLFNGGSDVSECVTQHAQSSGIDTPFIACILLTADPKSRGLRIHNHKNTTSTFKYGTFENGTGRSNRPSRFVPNPTNCINPTCGEQVFCIFLCISETFPNPSGNPPKSMICIHPDGSASNTFKNNRLSPRKHLVARVSILSRQPTAPLALIATHAKNF